MELELNQRDVDSLHQDKNNKILQITKVKAVSIAD